MAGTLLIAATAAAACGVRLGAAGGLGLIVLDLTMLATVLLVPPELSWPLYAAIAASLAWIAFTARSIPAIGSR